MAIKALEDRETPISSGGFIAPLGRHVSGEIPFLYLKEISDILILTQPDGKQGEVTPIGT